MNLYKVVLYTQYTTHSALEYEIIPSHSIGAHSKFVPHMVLYPFVRQITKSSKYILKEACNQSIIQSIPHVDFLSGIFEEKKRPILQIDVHHFFRYYNYINLVNLWWKVTLLILSFNQECLNWFDIQGQRLLDIFLIIFLFGCFSRKKNSWT